MRTMVAVLTAVAVFALCVVAAPRCDSAVNTGPVRLAGTMIVAGCPDAR